MDLLYTVIETWNFWNFFILKIPSGVREKKQHMYKYTNVEYLTEILLFWYPFQIIYLLSFGKLVVKQFTSRWRKYQKGQSSDNCIILLFNSNIKFLINMLDTFRLHFRKKMSGQQERSGQVNSNQFVPFLHWIFVNVFHEVNSCVNKIKY